jgi:hypothetical protein
LIFLLDWLLVLLQLATLISYTLAQNIAIWRDIVGDAVDHNAVLSANRVGH